MNNLTSQIECVTGLKLKSTGRNKVFVVYDKDNLILRGFKLERVPQSVSIASGIVILKIRNIDFNTCTS